MSNRSLPQSHRHYTVLIEVHERSGSDAPVTSEQHVAAVSPEQAIRRAGMRLVQKLQKETKETT